MSNEQKTKHTPGPWHSNNRPNDTLVLDGDDLIIAGIYMFPAPDREGQEQANAHLIAAAPELLAAAKGVQDIVDGMKDMERAWANELEALDAAIAKAEG